MNLKIIRKINYRHFYTLVVATVFSLHAFADVNEVIEKQWDFDSDGKIQLSNINGDVKITACNCEQVTMIAEIKASSQEVRDRISINISDSTSSLKIVTKYQNDHQGYGRNQYSEVNYRLSVPDNVRLSNIDLVNGNLIVTGVAGELNADLVNGELKSDGLTSSTKVNMVNGDVELRFVNLENAKSIDINSVNGDINLYLPSNADAAIKAETVSGNISNNFGINVTKHKYVGSEMQGTIGNGTVKIDLENVNGRISINSH